MEAYSDIADEMKKYPRQGEYTIADMMELPDGTLAELIDGVIYERSSPSTVHQEIIMNLSYEFYGFINDNHGTCHVWTAPLDVQLFPDDE